MNKQNDVLTQIKSEISKKNQASFMIDGVKVEIALKTLSKICLIELSAYLTDVKTKKNISNFIKSIDNIQESFVYKYDEKTKNLNVHACLWMDVKPTYSTLSELTNEMLSSIKSIIFTLESEEENG